MCWGLVNLQPLCSKDNLNEGLTYFVIFITMKKFIKKLLRENLLNEVDYNMGGCNFYAVALHRKHNLPIYVIRGYFKEEGWEHLGDWEYDFEDGHVVVALPNGNFLDSDGELTKDDLIEQTFGWMDKIEKVEFIQIDENEACNLYYGSDEQGEIKSDDETKINLMGNELQQIDGYNIIRQG